MPNSIKYSVSAQTLALKKGNYWIGTGDVPKGPTSTTDYWNGITPSVGGYTIYLNKTSQGPSIYVAANDAELIILTNRIASTSYTTTSECLSWFLTQTDKMVLNRDYESIKTDGLVLDLDAGFVSSYPKNGTTWYDLSGNENNASLVNGLQFNNTNSGEIYMDGGDEYIQVSPSVNLQSYFSNNSFTITLIVKSDNVVYPRSRCPIYVNSTVVGPSYKGWSAGHGASGSSMQIRVGDGTNLSQTDIPHVVSESTVYLRTFTIDRTNGALTKYYVNGSYIGQHNATNVTGSIYDGTNTDFVTGFVFGYVWGWRFIGGIYNIMVYNRLLSETEILQNFNAQKGRFGL
jgi:hypothetical protein